MELKRFQEAGEDYDHIAALEPTSLDPVLKAATAFERAEKPIRAVACLTTAIQLQPGEPDLYLRRSKLLQMTGDLAASRKDLARVQELCPDNREFGLELMQQHVAEGRPELALHVSESLLSGAKPADIVTIRQLRAALFEKVDRPHDAIREYARLSETPSCRIDALTRKARLHIAAGQWKPATLDLTAVLSTHPDDTELRLLRATAFEQLKQPSRCIDDLTLVLQKHPDHEVALRSRVRLLGRDTAALNDLARLRRLFPRDSAVRLQLADLCLLDGQHDRVLDVLSEVSDDDPNAAAQCYLCGATRFEMNDAAEARRWLNRAIDLQPQHTDARILRAVLLLDDKQPGAALADLEIAASTTEPGEDLLELRARALTQSGNPKQALADLDLALRLNSEFIEARRLRCQLRHKTGDHEGAVRDARKVLDDGSTNLTIRRVLADAEFSLERYDDAAADYENILDHSDAESEDIDLFWKLCQCRLHTDDQEAIFQSLNAILNRHPDHHEARFERARQRERIGELEPALDDLTELVLARRHDVDVLMARARIRHRIGQTQDAIDDLTLAIAESPRKAELYYRRGLSRNQLDDSAAAIADLDRAIELDDSQADVWYVRGNVLATSGRSTEAIDSYENAVARNPNHTAAWYNYGNMQFGRDDFDDAIRCWNEAIRTQPDLFRAYHNRAVALTRLDRPVEAADDYETTIALNPAFAQAYESLAWLLATAEPDALRDPEGAVALATRACELTKNENWSCLSTLAACQAEVGNFTAAQHAAEIARQVAPSSQQQRLTQLTQIYRQRAASRHSATRL